ncbi:hypothetical protein STRDD10_01769 [Streptococcus sp. DD10]|nr:hypothetical protein STRDD10_01769 [Streptococcus sp. DD10]
MTILNDKVWHLFETIVSGNLFFGKMKIKNNEDLLVYSSVFMVK